jgi:hypothetical protein
MSWFTLSLAGPGRSCRVVFGVVVFNRATLSFQWISRTSQTCTPHRGTRPVCVTVLLLIGLELLMLNLHQCVLVSMGDIGSPLIQVVCWVENPSNEWTLPIFHRCLWQQSALVFVLWTDLPQDKTKVQASGLYPCTTGWMPLYMLSSSAFWI